MNGKFFLTLVLLILFGASAVFAAAGQVADFMGTANQKAVSERKNVMIVFSDVKQLGLCRSFKTEILETAIFKSFAKKHLVIVCVDKKRNKKTAVTIDGVVVVVTSKEALAFEKTSAQLYRKYPHNDAPFAVILDAKGDKLFEQPGCPSFDAKSFVRKIISEISKKVASDKIEDTEK